MVVTSLVLAALAVALAWPAPVLLARARWPARAPATALILWQFVALAGGLSMLGAFVTFNPAPFGPDLVSSGISFSAQFQGNDLGRAFGPLQVLALSVGLVSMLEEDELSAAVIAAAVALVIVPTFLLLGPGLGRLLA